MKDFTASNGTPVDLSKNVFGQDALYVYEDDHTYPVEIASGNDLDAIREFFRAEEDERLGRWRWPADNRFVVYPWSGADDSDPRIAILDEGTGGQFSTTRATVSGNDEWAKVARAYFAAHPEPKPWHDANHNEIWVLFVAISEEAYRVDGGSFVPVNNPERIRIPLRDERIKSAHRIYPEGEVNA